MLDFEKNFMRSLYRVLASHLLSLGDVVNMVDVQDNCLIVHNVELDENFRFTLSVESLGGDKDE